MYSREELMSKPLSVLRGLDIQTKEDELMVNEVVNERLSALPPQQAVSRHGIPDITNQEDEARFQAVMDDRTEALKPNIIPNSSADTANRSTLVDEEVTPVIPAETNMGFNPLTIPLAEADGEVGEGVTFSSGVATPLQGTAPAKKAKSKSKAK